MDEESLLSGEYDGREFFLNELYDRDHTGQIYRLTHIEASTRRDLRHTHHFTFDPVIDTVGFMWPVMCRTQTMTPSGWHHVTLLELATMRTRLDNVILEEAKRRGME